jgi:hypothetical protein
MADYRKVDVEHELRRELEEARAEVANLRLQVARSNGPLFPTELEHLRSEVHTARMELARVNEELHKARAVPTRWTKTTCVTL